ncbi:unnamed protein product [Blepharisma stoltei]|uniref:Palmitoyltransferase n=1 Tax=Blepharisma stoltei TaxID=1481888 RepID=A0AAU9JQZ6_9CILI|nr:unnamed protein product [Blepharisma stoltei]
MNKKNGFRTPFHPFQIASWVVMIFHILIGILCISFLLSKEYLIVFLLLYYSTLLALLIQGLILTKSDPSVSIPIENIDKSPDAVNYLCTICKNYVTETSKHCGSCDRCVDRFDHHCKWLNNCIGKHNYKQFIILIVLLEINLSILIVFEISIIDKWKTHGLNKSKEIVQTDVSFIIADIIINASILLFNGYLIGFHIFLKFKKMTTYDFIQQRRIKKKKEIQPEMQPFEGEENGISMMNNDLKSPRGTNDEMGGMNLKSETEISSPKYFNQMFQISRSFHKSIITVDSDIVTNEHS